MPVVLEAAGGERHHHAACFLGDAGSLPAAAAPGGSLGLPCQLAAPNSPPAAGPAGFRCRPGLGGPDPRPLALAIAPSLRLALSTHIVVRAGRPTFKKGRCVRPPTVAVGRSIRKTFSRQPEDSVSLSEETRAAASAAATVTVPAATGASSCVPSDLCDFESQVP
jgi:hypothetical protein